MEPFIGRALEQGDCDDPTLEGANVADEQEAQPSAKPKRKSKSKAAKQQSQVIVHPPSPRTLQDLPTTIPELEALLPKFNAPPINTVEDELEDEIAALSLSSTPDFVKYLACHVKIIQTHRASINQRDHPQLWLQLELHEESLNKYSKYYTTLGQPSTAYRMNADQGANQPMEMDLDIDDQTHLSE